MRESRSSENPATRQRGQLVLIAAIVLALALVPLVLAYMQLGYHDDIHASSTIAPDREAERTLQHGLHDAVADIPRTYDWSDRTAAATTVRDRLEPTIEAVNRSGLDSGIAMRVSYNDTHAESWADANCPVGPDRQFGPCETDGGLVVQERQGDTHVLGVAVDLRISTPDADLYTRRFIEVR